MSTTLSRIWPLLLGIALMALSNGLQGSLVGVEAAKADFSSTTTGIITSGFSVGLFLSAFLTPLFVSRVGHIRVFAAYASVLSTAILLIPIWIDPVWWFTMRLLAGVCTAGLYIVVESWLNSASTNATRGTLLSVYMVLVYGGMGIGNLLLVIDDPSGFVRFVIVSALMSLALVPVALTNVAAPEVTGARSIAVAEIFRASPLAVVATFANGVAQSAFFGLGALFGVMQGMSLPQVSLMMALPPIAVIVSQMPIGWLSDRIDRRKLILANSAVAALTAGGAIWAGIADPVLLIGAMAVFGAVAMPVYSLALAHANDQLEADQVLAASSKLVLIYGVGAIVGPSIAGGFMQQLGGSGFLVFMIAVFGFLAAYAAYRMTQRTAPAPQTTGDLVPVSPMMTGVTAAAVAQEIADTAGPSQP